MISLHHAHLMASDVDATIAFWRDHFRGEVVRRLRAAGASVTDVREVPDASYAMVQGPDGLLLELFQPNPARVPEALARSGYFASLAGD